jgi:hypothetical protein
LLTAPQFLTMRSFACNREPPSRRSACQLADREAEVTDAELDDRRAHRRDEPAADQGAESATCFACLRKAAAMADLSPFVTAAVPD